MDDPEATATQTPPPPATAEVPAVPAPEAPVESPAPVEAEAPVPTPAEAETPETPEVPLDPRDELEQERFKPHLERRDRRIVERVRQEEATTRQEAQVSVDAQEVTRSLQNIYGNIAQKLGDGDSEAVERLLPRLEAAAAPFVGAEKKKLRDEGNKEGQAQLHQGILAAVQQSLGQRVWEDMEDYYTTTTSGLTWVDILDKYHELRSGGAKETWKTEKTTLEAQIEDLKAKARPEGPDTTPKGGGGGKKYLELTSEERRAMSSAEVDAMQARERGER
jgi:hypothetical protein